MKSLIFAAIVLCCSVAVAQQTWTVKPRHGSWSNGYTIQQQRDPFQRAMNQYQYNMYQSILRPLAPTWQYNQQYRSPYQYNYRYNWYR